MVTVLTVGGLKFAIHCHIFPDQDTIMANSAMDRRALRQPLHTFFVSFTTNVVEWPFPQGMHNFGLTVATCAPSEKRTLDVSFPHNHINLEFRSLLLKN